MFGLFKKIIASFLLFVIASIFPTFGGNPQRCASKFSGTFIQSWMCGNWSIERWQKEFEYMSEVGNEYLILQCCASKEKDGRMTCDYDSTLEALADAYTGSPVIENALACAKEYGMKVFVGLAYYDNWFADAGTSDEYNEICRLCADMAKEIYTLYHEKYPNELYGWYYVPEINNAESFRRNIDVIASGVKLIADSLSANTPDMPLMLSPFFSSYARNSSYTPMLIMWSRFFQYAGLRPGDILAPQDSMGGYAVDDAGLHKRWQMYSSAVKAAGGGIKLWANCEVFSSGRDENGAPNPDIGGGYTKTLDRFSKQMYIASEYCEEIITFSYNHYMSPALVNPVFHNTYLDYLKNNYTVECVAPASPANVTAKIENNAVTVSWNASFDNIGIAYYQLYRDGIFVGNIESSTAQVPTEYVDTGVSDLSHAYTVRAVDGAGNRSE